MSVSFHPVVSADNTTSTSSGTNITVTIQATSSVTVGNYYVACFQSNFLVNTLTVGNNNLTLLTSYSTTVANAATTTIYVFGGYIVNAPGVGLITANMGSAAFQSINWNACIGYLTGMNTSAPIVQTSSVATTAATTSGTPTASLSTFGSSSNGTLVMGVVGRNASVTITPNSGYSGMTQASIVAVGSTMFVEFNPANDTAPACSYSTSLSANASLIAFEIAAIPPAVPNAYGSVIGTTTTVPQTPSASNYLMGVITGSNGTTFTINNAIPTDVYMIVYYTYSAGYAATSITTSKGTITQILVDATADPYIYACYVTGVTGSTVISPTPSGSYATVTIDKIIGCTNAPVVQHNLTRYSNDISAKTTSLAAFASTSNATYVAANYDRGSSSVWTPNSGYTQLGNTYINPVGSTITTFKLGQDLTPGATSSESVGYTAVFACELQFRTDTVNVPPALRTLSTMGMGS
jgi:hypothetical protein